MTRGWQVLVGLAIVAVLGLAVRPSGVDPGGAEAEGAGASAAPTLSLVPLPARRPRPLRRCCRSARSERHAGGTRATIVDLGTGRLRVTPAGLAQVPAGSGWATSDTAPSIRVSRATGLHGGSATDPTASRASRASGGAGRASR